MDPAGKRLFDKCLQSAVFVPMLTTAILVHVLTQFFTPI
jgi:hypothetical protein